jgi:hypothetical protein
MHSFSPKARSFITRPPEKDKRYNILCGSVRSGKTWTMMAKLFLLCRYNVGGPQGGPYVALYRQQAGRGSSRTHFEKFSKTGFRLGAPASSRIAALTKSVFFVGKVPYAECTCPKQCRRGFT